jgi:hypothetical protein
VTRSAVALAALLTLLLTAAPALAGDPIMPLAAVRAGMQCTGLTVVKGTAVTSFDVAIEDVVAIDPSGVSPRLLIRASGPAVDATGLGPGFSGSPIYCPGDDGVQRVAGAVSESLGEYGGKVALATPIESILGQPVDPPAGTRSAPALIRSARPIATPLSIGGLSAPVASIVRRAATKAGRVIYTVPAAPRAGFPAVPLVPGSAMAVGLASGAINAGAIGTVAYVDGDRVWGFGHELDAAGRRQLFLQDAYVYTVINNPVGTEDAQTYKLAAPGHDVGTLTSDGIDAVAGRLGVLPTRFPMHIVARDQDTGRLQSTDLQVADESGVDLPTGASALSDVGPLAIAQAAFQILSGAPTRQSASMCARFELQERKRPLRFCNTYVGSGGDGDTIAAAPLVADFGKAAALVDAYDVAPLHLTRVQVDMKLRRGLRQAVLVGVRGPSRVRRGHDVRLRVTMRRVLGKQFQRTLEVHVPSYQPTGDFDLTLKGPEADRPSTSNDTTDVLGSLLSLFGSLLGDQEAPTSVDELADQIAAIHRYDGVSASFIVPGADPFDEDAPPERPAYRDPELRISGTASLPVSVVSDRKRRRR